MKKTLKNLIGASVLGAMALTGCNQTEMNEPVRENYDLKGFYFEGNYIEDFDDNGSVDIIHNNKRPSIYVAKDMRDKITGKNFSIDKARDMPHEMRDTASNLLRARNELLYQFDKAEYEAQKE